MRLWQVLIATVPHRAGPLGGLLHEIDRQWQDMPPHWQRRFGVLLYRDNALLTIAAKRQALLKAATAEYVCFADDDDMVLPGYVSLILPALGRRPDYAGFCIRLTTDGLAGPPAEHSLRNQGWAEAPDLITRDISHLNPVRRELALLGTFDGEYSEDSRWAQALRESGLVRDEAWIGRELYWYRFSTEDNSHGKPLAPMPEAAIPPLPAYPWLEVL